jgi:hypothetical protein
MKFYRQARIQYSIPEKNSNLFTQTIDITGLRISFSIAKSIHYQTNTAIIKIWNIGQDKRNKIIDYNALVILFAGYENDGGLSNLFRGYTTSVSHIYDFPDIITILECGEGERFINNSRVALSYSGNIPAKTIISDIVAKMGMRLIEFTASSNLVYRQGFSGIYMGKVVLKTVCDKLGLEAIFVGEDQVRIVTQGQTGSSPPFQINSNTGMIGVPQRFTWRNLEPYRAANAPNTGYKVNIALNPLIIPGSTITLDSTHIDFKGLYLVRTVRHEGDTFGQVWASNLEVVQQTEGSTQ